MEQPVSDDLRLNAADRAELLGAARRAIETYTATQARLAWDDASENLKQHAGAFVTLHKGGMLRGCIGTFATDRPLIDTVIEMAISAASRDPRFSPVTANEVTDLDIEISVLSRPRVAAANDVSVGTHGITIAKGMQRGVLLPQVATENGWDRETFLRQTCRKAGLNPDAWRDSETVIEVFTSDIIAESDVP